MILSLPSEMLEEILLRLDGVQVLAMRLVCEAMFVPCSNASLWRERIRRLSGRSGANLRSHLACLIGTHNALAFARMEGDIRLRKSLISMIDERLNTSRRLSNVNFPPPPECGAITQSLRCVEPLVCEPEDNDLSEALEPYAPGNHIEALVGERVRHAIVVATPNPGHDMRFFMGTQVVHQASDVVLQDDLVRWLGLDHDEPLPPLFIVSEAHRLDDRDALLCASRVLMTNCRNIPDTK
jgi:hypothetical protein